MHDQLQFHVGNTSQSEACVYFSMRNDSKILSATGSFIGPHCEHSRTLPAEFKIRLSTHPATQQTIAEITIIDPCYWNPALPFTYEVELQIQDTNGLEIAYRGTLGMRRWHGAKKSFYLDLRRCVLRGYRCNEPNEDALQVARQQELTLIVDPTDRSFYQTANRLGVGLVVDLRNVGKAISDHVYRLNDSPSVMVALVSTEQLSQLDTNHRPKQCLLAQCLTAGAQPNEIIGTTPDAFAIELKADERPPLWLADIEKPLIAIHCLAEEPPLHSPRRRCEKLQATLAPDFSLAGYFVTS